MNSKQNPDKNQDRDSNKRHVNVYGVQSPEISKCVWTRSKSYYYEKLLVLKLFNNSKAKFLKKCYVQCTLFPNH